MKLMATDTFKGWDADLANNGICGLCYNYYDGARSFMGHKAYNTPADLKGDPEGGGRPVLPTSCLADACCPGNPRDTSLRRSRSCTAADVI